MSRSEGDALDQAAAPPPPPDAATGAPAGGRHTRAILRATALLGSSSLASIAFSFVASKVNAVVLGPNGIGLSGLLQAEMGVPALLAALGVSTAIVREVAAASARGDHVRVAALRRAAHVIVAVTGAITLLVFLVFTRRLSALMLRDASEGRATLLMGAGVVFTLVSGVETGFLNGFHRVAALARLAVINAALGALIFVVLIAGWRQEGIAWAMLLSAVSGCLVTLWMVRREIGRVGGAPASEVGRAARALLAFGLPYTVSVLASTGVQQVLPTLVLHMLDQTSVGLYRAAATISVTYLGVLVTAMGQDYYPRVASAPDDRVALGHLLDDQHRTVVLLALPLICGLLAGGPIVLPIVYSRRFTPALDVLEWQLIGDFFRLASWTMSHMLLARLGGLVFFFTELAAGVLFLGTGYLGMRLWGLPGMGISFLVTYFLYYVIVAVTLRARLGVRLSLDNFALLAVSVALLVGARLVPWPSVWARCLAYLVLFVLGSALALTRLWRATRAHN